MTGLAELQSIEKSHILWQELTNDNGSVSILFYCILLFDYMISQQKRFYVPQEIQHSSFPCHIAEFAVSDKDQQLLSYVISTYQTIKVVVDFCDKLKNYSLILGFTNQTFDMLSRVYW